MTSSPAVKGSTSEAPQERPMCSGTLSCGNGWHDALCPITAYQEALQKEMDDDEARVSQAVPQDARCLNCQAWTTPTELLLGYCARCVSLFRGQGRWCETHGPTLGYCLGEQRSAAEESRAIDRLRGDSAVARLTAGLDRDAADAAGRIKGVLSLCGRGLTDSEVQRVRAQVRAELLSFLIKATGEIGQEWFDMIGARQIPN